MLKCKEPEEHEYIRTWFAEEEGEEGEEEWRGKRLSRRHVMSCRVFFFLSGFPMQSSLASRHYVMMEMSMYDNVHPTSEKMMMMMSIARLGGPRTVSHCGSLTHCADELKVTRNSVNFSGLQLYAFIFLSPPWLKRCQQSANVTVWCMQQLVHPILHRAERRMIRLYPFVIQTFFCEGKQNSLGLECEVRGTRYVLLHSNSSHNIHCCVFYSHTKDWLIYVLYSRVSTSRLTHPHIWIVVDFFDSSHFAGAV